MDAEKNEKISVFRVHPCTNDLCRLIPCSRQIVFCYNLPIYVVLLVSEVVWWRIALYQSW